MRPPKVDLQRQSSSEDFNVTLLCIAKDFYPDEIFLKWEEENQEISFKGYDTHGMKCDHEKQTCSLLSMLEVPTSKWMMGASYRCLVAHVSSENIIDRTTNFLTGKKNQCPNCGALVIMHLLCIFPCYIKTICTNLMFLSFFFDWHLVYTKKSHNLSQCNTPKMLSKGNEVFF
uniref:Ig-like domain-containing protein n=1 Tax=Pseudonaja textilis TaxID=8673 RepID=A0A670Z0A7_PSETE